MPQYARAITGTTGGFLGNVGGGSTTINARWHQFTLNSSRRQNDASGFGDAGETYTVDGPHRWVAVAQGWILVTPNLNPELYTGTQNFIGSVTFGPDAGLVYGGSAKIQNIQLSGAYRTGEAPCSCQIIGYGPLSEGTAA